MFYRIYQLFLDSFKFLYREKFSFYISVFTISICLILVSLISIISLASVKKIKGIEIPTLIISYSQEELDIKCIDYCSYDNEQCPECAIYWPSKLDLKGTDSKADKPKYGVPLPLVANRDAKKIIVSDNVSYTYDNSSVKAQINQLASGCRFMYQKGRRKMTNVDTIIIHWSASRRAADKDTDNLSYSTLHSDHNGYHFIIDYKSKDPIILWQGVDLNYSAGHSFSSSSYLAKTDQ